jgi:hypothetical protein
MREGHGFVSPFANIALPGFALVFLAAAWLAGIYDNRYKPAKAFYSAVVAIIVMLAVYSLLPERFRFSRGIIFFGGLAASILVTTFRWLLLKYRIVDDTDEAKKQHQTVVVSTADEFKEVRELMRKSGLKDRIMGRIASDGVVENALGAIEHLKTLLESLTIKEIIFCKGHLSYATIIEIVQQLPRNIGVRFHACGSHSIVGSDSKDAAGHFVSLDGSFQLTNAYQKRMKRLLDISLSLFILVTFPIHILFVGLKCIHNALVVLLGRKTWISYSQPRNWLPSLPPGVLTTTGFPVNLVHPNRETANLIDHWYAKNYDWTQDLKLIVRHYNHLGGRA